MGRKRRRKSEKFLSEHPNCCLCGGTVSAKTTEHCPPRILFKGKYIPGAFEFPACEFCNSESAAADQVAAFFAQAMAHTLSPHVTNDDVRKLAEAIINNHPEIAGIFGGPSEEVSIRIAGGSITLDRFEISSEIFEDWLNPWAAKLATAFWYHETGRILPDKGRISIQWRTNAVMHEVGFPSDLVEAMPRANWVRYGRQEFDEQFFYRFGHDQETDFGGFLFGFHNTSAVLAGVDPSGTLIEMGEPWSTFRIAAGKGIEALS